MIYCVLIILRDALFAKSANTHRAGSRWRLAEAALIHEIGAVHAPIQPACFAAVIADGPDFCGPEARRPAAQAILATIPEIPQNWPDNRLTIFVSGSLIRPIGFRVAASSRLPEGSPRDGTEPKSPQPTPLTAVEFRLAACEGGQGDACLESAPSLARRIDSLWSTMDERRRRLRARQSNGNG